MTQSDPPWPFAEFGPNLGIRAREWLDANGIESKEAASSLGVLLVKAYQRGEADERSIWQEHVPDVEALRKLARVAEDVAVIANTSPDAMASLPRLEADALRKLLDAAREWRATLTKGPAR